MNRLKLTILLLVVICLAGYSQEKKYALYCVAFYNMENLFDTIHDDGKNDYDFLPTGSYKWNSHKYQSKLKNMSTVISRLGGKQLQNMGPAVIGLAEVENDNVLNDLVKQTPIKDRNYQYIHIEGEDLRGIDCALLYNPMLFQPTDSKLFPYINEEDSTYKTRGFLVVTGYLAGENVTFIVNHWPSRAATSPARERAGRQVRAITDSIMANDNERKIIIMGDLNDDPVNKSITEALGAKKSTKGLKPTDLYDPWWKTFVKDGIGTLMYNGTWNLFDQIIVSGNLIGKDRSTLKYLNNAVFNPEYMFQKQGKYKGYPLRTTAGGVWLNGYSDHLPTQIFLIKEID